MSFHIESHFDLGQSSLPQNKLCSYFLQGRVKHILLIQVMEASHPKIMWGVKLDSISRRIPRPQHSLATEGTGFQWLHLIILLHEVGVKTEVLNTSGLPNGEFSHGTITQDTQRFLQDAGATHAASTIEHNWTWTRAAMATGSRQPNWKQWERDEALQPRATHCAGVWPLMSLWLLSVPRVPGTKWRGDGDGEIAR